MGKKKTIISLCYVCLGSGRNKPWMDRAVKFAGISIFIGFGGAIVKSDASAAVPIFAGIISALIWYGAYCRNCPACKGNGTLTTTELTEDEA